MLAAQGRWRACGFRFYESLLTETVPVVAPLAAARKRELATASILPRTVPQTVLGRKRKAPLEGGFSSVRPGNRGQVSKLISLAKNFLPGLADKRFFQSPCIPAPSFDSPWPLPTAKAQRAFAHWACRLVRPGRIELPTRPWQGRIIPLNHGRVLRAHYRRKGSLQQLIQLAIGEIEDGDAQSYRKQEAELRMTHRQIHICETPDAPPHKHDARSKREKFKMIPKVFHVEQYTPTPTPRT